MPRLSLPGRRSDRGNARLRILAAAATLIVALMPFVAQTLRASATSTPILLVEPAVTTAGADVTVLGEGFPHKPGALVFDGTPATGSGSGGPSFHADQQGSFSEVVAIPASATVGAHTIVAFAQNDELVASVGITVLGSTPTESPTALPSPTLRPGPTATATSTPTPTPSSTPAATSPPATTGVTFVGAGDIAGAETSNQIANISGTVFTLGDNAYPDGSISNYATYYDPTWGRFKSRTRPATGNHDYHQLNALGYRAYFSYASSDPLYYSYDLGSWHIIALDSGNCDNAPAGCAVGSAQERWLAEDLAAHDQQCTLAYFHHARFTSGATHPPDQNVQAFWADLYAANAEVILSGHNHQYERFAPQNPSGAADASRGIRQFVVGTGGSGLYGFGTAQPNSQVRYNGSPGVLKLTLEAGAYAWSFLPSSGTFTDTGTTACH